jgi:hypothetical protein
MAQESFDKLLQFFKALGNESRLKIIGLLANGERSVGELANLLDVKEPTVSHHLAMLKELGLVRVRGQGNVRYYRLDTSGLEEMSRDVFSQNNLATIVTPAHELTPKEKLLRQYVVDGRINALPSKHQKLQFVLEWLAEQVEVDARYTESEFNQLLRAYYPDHATLRRYLVDYNLVRRDHGIYWRPGSE